MHKKLLSILTFVLFTLILVACDNGTKEVQLPVLNGQTQSQITTTLN